MFMSLSKGDILGVELFAPAKPWFSIRQQTTKTRPMAPTNPIGSTGLVYLPTWMVDFYGKFRYIYQSHGSYESMYIPSFWHCPLFPLSASVGTFWSWCIFQPNFPLWVGDMLVRSFCHHLRQKKTFPLSILLVGSLGSLEWFMIILT